MMRTYRAAATLAVLALALNGCGSDSVGPNAAFVGGWMATTSQGRILRFYVEEQGIVMAAVGFTVDGTLCDEDLVVFISREDASDDPFLISDRDFTIQTSGAGGTITVSGTVAEGDQQASGTITVNSITCNGTASATFTATRASGPDMDLSGLWFGTSQSSLTAPSVIIFDLEQTGANLTGTFSSGAGGAGTVSGSVSGKLLRFTLRQTTPGCTGTFTGHGVMIDAPVFVRFQFTGSDCLGTHENGSGTADQTP